MSGPIGHMHAMVNMFHVKRARVEGIGNVFPKQIRNLSNITFQSETSKKLIG